MIILATVIAELDFSDRLSNRVLPELPETPYAVLVRSVLA
jgi:hypothetical protein